MDSVQGVDGEFDHSATMVPGRVILSDSAQSADCEPLRVERGRIANWAVKGPLLEKTDGRGADDYPLTPAISYRPRMHCHRLTRTRLRVARMAVEVVPRRAAISVASHSSR